MAENTNDKFRDFIFTNWNLNSERVFNREMTISFMAFGEEHCPDTGRLHHQGFLRFTNPRSGSKKNCCRIADLFVLEEGDKHGSVQPMYGSFKSNEKYCSKQDSLTKLGREPEQGERTDLKELQQKIKNGKRVDDLVLENPIWYHQYGRTLEKIEAIYLRKKFRTEMTQGVWYWGTTGVGKSHYSFEGFDPDTHYVKNLNEDWWDGYVGQETVIFNEFRGQVAFGELLDLVDKWPKTVKWRNREPVPFLAKRLVISSPMHPENLYVNMAKDDKFEQFWRRFVVIHLTKKFEPCLP